MCKASWQGLGRLGAILNGMRFCGLKFLVQGVAAAAPQALTHGHVFHCTGLC